MKVEQQMSVRTVGDIGRVMQWAANTVALALRGGEVVVGLGRARRSNAQNAKLWPMLQDVASQCQLVINGVPCKASKEDWKHIFTANLHKQTRMALGIDGEVVFLGYSTSRMNKKTFCELIELIYAYGSEHGVVWSEPALQAYEDYKEAA